MNVKDVLKKIEMLKDDLYPSIDEIIILSINISGDLINILWRFENNEEINEFTF